MNWLGYVVASSGRPFTGDSDTTTDLEDATGVVGDDNGLVPSFGMSTDNRLRTTTGADAGAGAGAGAGAKEAGSGFILTGVTSSQGRHVSILLVVVSAFG